MISNTTQIASISTRRPSLNQEAPIRDDISRMEKIKDVSKKMFNFIKSNAVQSLKFSNEVAFRAQAQATSFRALFFALSSFYYTKDFCLAESSSYAIGKGFFEYKKMATMLFIFSLLGNFDLNQSSPKTLGKHLGKLAIISEGFNKVLSKPIMGAVNKVRDSLFFLRIGYSIYSSL